LKSAIMNSVQNREKEDGGSMYLWNVTATWYNVPRAESTYIHSFRLISSKNYSVNMVKVT
jgi:hypothetical protein